MKPDAFLKLALSLPDAVQAGHFDVTDVRVGGKIFATLRRKDGRAVLKLSPGDQQLLMITAPATFRPVPGAWGARGWTEVVLQTADLATVRHAMSLAHMTVSPGRTGAKQGRPLRQKAKRSSK